jgi:hypothetical protein
VPVQLRLNKMGTFRGLLAKCPYVSEMTHRRRLAEVQLIEDERNEAKKTEDKRHEYGSGGPRKLDSSPCKPDDN